MNECLAKLPGPPLEIRRTRRRKIPAEIMFFCASFVAIEASPRSFAASSRLQLIDIEGARCCGIPRRRTKVR
jgi:hypothetical protein